MPRCDDGACNADVRKDCAKTDQPPGQPVFMGVPVAANVTVSAFVGVDFR
jgi:hypothetical protein